MSKKPDIKESFIPPLLEENEDSSLLIFKGKSKTFDSSKLNEAETVSASIETPQTAFFENEKKLLDKFTQMQEDGFSSSEIMEALGIDKEFYKKLSSV